MKKPLSPAPLRACWSNELHHLNIVQENNGQSWSANRRKEKADSRPSDEATEGSIATYVLPQDLFGPLRIVICKRFPFELLVVERNHITLKG
jgi:hypothetical protein